MKKILLSIAMLGVVGALGVGATSAIFSDDEASTGNTFTAGAVDLRVDNESYYNGQLNEGTTWLQAANLDDGNGPADGQYLFFDFDDVKPGDWGEDTISLHVENNDSWACVDVTLTSDDDNGFTEPEEGDGDTTPGDDDGVGGGELADAIDFIWWADDGDNVYESDETLLPSGPLGNLEVGETAVVALADSNGNIWDGDGPLPGDSVRYIGKGWCLGELTPDPVDQDGLPGGNDNGPLVRGEGFQCDGSEVDNITQTDSMSADIVFYVEQSRHNGEFVCGGEPVVPETTITVVKTVDNLAGGSAVVADFPLFVDATEVLSNEPLEVVAGAYVVSETNDVEGYSATFSGACDVQGNITAIEDQNVTCTITNTFSPDVASLTVTKVVEGGPLAVGDFALFVDATEVTSGDETVFVTGAHTVSEVDDSSLYTSVIGGDCDANGDITLETDVAASCTITNTYAPADITIDKIVQFSNQTLNVSVGDFDLFLNDGVNPVVQVTDEVLQGDLPAGTYTVSEVYTGSENITVNAVFSGDCSDDGSTGTIVVGADDSTSCTITNIISAGVPTT